MSENPQLALKVISGPDAGRTFALGEVNFVGRHSPCDIQLTDPRLESMHARIGKRGDAHTLTDLAKVPGVRVNGHLVKSRKLALGDRVSMGDTVFEVIDAALGIKEQKPESPESDRVVVATEEDPSPRITANLEKASQIAVGSEQKARGEADRGAKKARGEADRGGKKAEAAESRVVMDSELQRYRSKAILEGPRGETKKGVRLAMLGGLVLVIGVISACFIFRVTVTRRGLDEQYRAAAEFQERFPDDVDSIIEKYERVRTAVAGGHPRLDGLLDERIQELEKVRAKKKAEMEDLLRSLDGKAALLASAGSFDEALRVYEPDDMKLRGQVALARKEAIAGLRRQAQEKRAAEEKKKEEDLKLAQQKQVEEKLKKLLADTADALIGARYEDARRCLESVVSDKDLESVKIKADGALVDVRLLEIADRDILAAVPKGKDPVSKNVLPDNTTQRIVEGLSPMLKAIYAIRKNDPMVAEAHLKDAQEHFLYEPLVARIRLSDEEQKMQDEAIQQCGLIWRKVVREEVSKIPVPADCLAQLKKAAEDPKREDLAKVCGDLAKCGEQYKNTRFARKYAELFLTAREMGIRLERQSRASGFGDGKIIQADREKFFVELRNPMSDTAGKSVGLFKEKTVFYLKDGDKLVAAKIALYAVLPFQPIGDRQIAFVMPEGDAGFKPAVGDHVLVEKDLTRGIRFIAGPRTTESPVLFEDDFSGKLDTRWKVSQAKEKIEDGRLVVDVAADKREAGKPDLVLDLALGVETARMELDLVAHANQGVTIVMGDLEFVLGGDGTQKEGIYLRGNLAKAAAPGKPLGIKGTQHMVLLKSRAMARMEVNRQTVEALLPAREAASDVKNIGFFIVGKVSLDNVKVDRPWIPGRSEVVGYSPDRREVVISRGFEPPWQGVGLGREIFFFEGSPGAEKVPVVGRVEGSVGNWFFCLLPEGKTVGAECLVSLSGQASIPVEEPGAAEPGAPAGETGPAVLSGTVRNSISNGVAVVLDSPEPFPAKGYLHPVEFAVQHPKSGEIMAFWPGKGIPCELAAGAGVVLCRASVDALVMPITNQAVLIATRLLPGNQKAEIEGKTRLFGKMVRTGKSKTWEIVGGKWRERLSRYVSTPGGAEDVPVLATTETVGGNLQFDCDMIIEKSGALSEDPWVRDFMLEMYSASRQVGLTFGIGAGRDKNIVVTGQALQPGKGARVLKKQVSLPAGAKVKTEVTCPKGSLLIKTDKEYNVRVRKVGDVLALYINGKRVAHVSYPGFEGDLQFRLAAPEAPVSIGKIVVRALPPSCRIPDEEPALGEFGYVLWTDGTQILIDSDMNGVGLQRRVTVLAVEKVVQGEASRSVMTKSMAEAIVTEVGGRTCKAMRMGKGEPIEKGMKVFLGTFSPAPVFVDGRINDLDQGL